MSGTEWRRKNQHCVVLIGIKGEDEKNKKKKKKE